MCFGSKSNPKFSTGIDATPRPVHQYVNKPSNGISGTSKPSTGGGFLANTPYGRSKAIQEQIKAGETEGVKRPRHPAPIVAGWSGRVEVDSQGRVWRD